MKSRTSTQSCLENLVKLAHTVCVVFLCLSDKITSLSAFGKTVRPGDLLLPQTVRIERDRLSANVQKAFQCFRYHVKNTMCNLHSGRFQLIAILLHNTHTSTLADGK